MSATSGLTTSPLPFPAHSLSAQHTGARHAPASQEQVFCFAIQAAAEPGVMPRVLELLAKRGLVPLRWHADRIGVQGDELAIDMQVTGLDAHTSDYMARCLRQIYGVETVLTSEKNLG
ncbi:hypothetical protein [Aquibaculum sediminis]|uniref:hypothetical protein n=1 Tax=Aquibaculum sediminis TaxID=3231907 RepID=UPI0034534B66